MFKLIGTICILSVNNTQFDLCFKAAETGIEYQKLNECKNAGKQIVKLIDTDVASRNLKIVLTCKPSEYQGANYNVVISN